MVFRVQRDDPDSYAQAEYWGRRHMQRARPLAESRQDGQAAAILVTGANRGAASSAANSPAGTGREKRKPWP
jgi:hypothetical protein